MDACRVGAPGCSDLLGQSSRRSLPSRKQIQASTFQRAPIFARVIRTDVTFSPARATRSLSPTRAEGIEGLEGHRIDVNSVGRKMRRELSREKVKCDTVGSPASGSSVTPAVQVVSLAEAKHMLIQNTNSKPKSHASPVQADAKRKSPLPLPTLPERYEERQKAKMEAEITSHLLNSGVGALLKPQSAVQSNTSINADLPLRKEWSEVLKQVLNRDARAKAQSGGYPSNSGAFSRTAADNTKRCNVDPQVAFANELRRSLLHQTSSCSLACDSSTTLPSPRSTPASTPRSYIAFSSPVGKLFSWKQVGVHTDTASSAQMDDSVQQAPLQDVVNRTQTAKKGIPPLRLDMLPTVPEPERL